MGDSFSVLMSVYGKDNPEHFYEALKSVFELQRVKPSEVILVKDGPLPKELEREIEHFYEHNLDILTLVSLDDNVGLGNALKEGIKYCSNEWIARMDSDDIAVPARFEKQFLFLEKHPEVDILGGWICEFDQNPKHCTRERKVPATHSEIVKFSKYRNPMNHVTVIFKKSVVEEAGGYQSMNGFEDYYLWMRLIKRGKKFANIPYVIVKVRTGQEMIRRRQGWQYAKDETSLEVAAYKIGFWSGVDLFKNFFIRFLPRLMPVFIVEKLYNLLRKF